MMAGVNDYNSPPSDQGNPATPESPNARSPPRAVPSLRSVSDPQQASSSAPAVVAPLAGINAARRPPVASISTIKSGGLGKDIQARMLAFQQSRQNSNLSASSPNSSSPITGSPSSINSPVGIPQQMMNGNLGRVNRPLAQNWSSAPSVPGARPPIPAPKTSLGARRGLKLPGGLPGGLPGSLSAGIGNSGSDCSSNPAATAQARETGFTKFEKFLDTTNGSLKFAGKAVIHGKGVDFSSGSSFSISLDEVDIIDELGKGNYGTVYTVIHRKPTVGGLTTRMGGKRRSSLSLSTSAVPTLSSAHPFPDVEEPPTSLRTSKTAGSGVIMAMKEIRLELDEAKFAAIIMELDILHKCVSPYIIDFYGAFFQEGAVYICMEHMDGGSIDKLYGEGIPENVLRKITLATVRGLKVLKDDHNIIHRDVKPTNILVNTLGEVKLCDFGVSGNLVASIAKTNIGCQSYMAPERISGGGMAQAGAVSSGTYGVQSDIWSLGLSILESAMGCYPYPPETYNNIFSQLSAIVDGPPPDLPAEGWSEEARDFVRGCLHKIPNLRPTYAMLLNHPWLKPLTNPSETDPVPTITEDEEEEAMAEAGHEMKQEDAGVSIDPTENKRGDEDVRKWVVDALERKTALKNAGKPTTKEKPALHAAPLDAIHSPGLDKQSQLEVKEAVDGICELKMA